MIKYYITVQSCLSTNKPHPFGWVCFLSLDRYNGGQVFFFAKGVEHFFADFVFLAEEDVLLRVFEYDFSDEKLIFVKIGNDAVFGIGGG